MYQGEDGRSEGEVRRSAGPDGRTEREWDEKRRRDEKGRGFETREREKYPVTYFENLLFFNVVHSPFYSD